MQPEPDGTFSGPGGYAPPQQTIASEIPQQVVIGQQQPHMVEGFPNQPVMVMVQPEHNDNLITAVWILSACSLIISPLFCGLPAFICAIIALTQNHPKGVQALIVSIVCPIIGVVIAIVVLGSLAGL